jgi:DNA repair photolyase
MEYIKRKTLLYKTGVEYGDYTINHVQGCSHGCTYPCYAMMMAKRFGRVKSYEEWCKPKLVSNAEEILKKEIPKFKNKIDFVHLSFATDPFMYGFGEVTELSLKLIKMLNEANIKCTVLTKGILPVDLADLNHNNEAGITIVSLNDEFLHKYEPFAAPIHDRIDSLYQLHKKGIKTWVSIEPYPTPNIVEQDLNELLNAVSFVDKIIFGRMNYNPLVTKFKGYKDFYNQLSYKLIDYCNLFHKKFYIKKGTFTGKATI